jgi:putative transposase
VSWYLQAIGLSPQSWKEPVVVENTEIAHWKALFESIQKDTPCYGYRKMVVALKRVTGVAHNHKKIMRLMRLTGCAQKKKRVYTPRTTDSRHALRTYPNLVAGVVPVHPHHVWVTDITYVRLPISFCYVAIVLDVFTKHVLGFAVALHMRESMVREALEMALQKGTPVFHHSDRGGQYCATAYIERLTSIGTHVSMAATGVSVDNPFAESFNRTLKVEEVYLHAYESIEEARTSIGTFITDVYHSKRIHQSLGYVTPDEFVEEWQVRHSAQSVSVVV